MTDALIAEWQQRVREAAAQKTPLCIRGGGSKDFYGEVPTGTVLDTRGLTGVIDYDPTELVITARCGTTLAELESTMAGRGQMLAFEPPHFAAGATLGGAIAAGLSGPRRAYAGAVRDVVLGVRMLDGQGEDLRFGGRVMKNVAGFDVSRAMAGAMGTLGVLLEISLKCLPLPRISTTLVTDARPSEALVRMNQSGGKPYPITATCHYQGKLYVRLSGAKPAVESAARNLGGEPLQDADAFWAALREHTLPTLANAPEIWRLSVRSTAPHIDVPGDQVIEWGGALRWIALSTPGDAARLRNIAAEHGGHATLFRAIERRAGVFTPLSPPIEQIHRRMKSAFDPAGILNPGRLYPNL